MIFSKTATTSGYAQPGTISPAIGDGKRKSNYRGHAGQAATGLASASRIGEVPATGRGGVFLHWRCPNDRSGDESDLERTTCAANRPRWRRWPFLSVSLATLLGAWFFQFVLKLPPCPLCLEAARALLRRHSAFAVGRHRRVAAGAAAPLLPSASSSSSWRCL